MVAVAHPDLFIALAEPAIQQIKLRCRGCDISAPKLGCAVPAFHMAARHLVAHDRVDDARRALREGIEAARAQGESHAAGEMAELLMSLGESGEEQ